MENTRQKINYSIGYMKKQQPKVFVTSDTFFGRKATATKRGFTSCKEMEEYLIEKWNDKVSDSDTVIHLGNFAWSPNDIEGLLEKLNGKIIFFPGDKDEALLQVSEVNKSIEIMENQILFYGNAVFSHWPLEVWPGKDKGLYHFHGHINPNIRTDIKKMNRVNACCDNWSLAPIEINDTIELLKEFM
jgi:calcineurin-like phosphoesterase family protein